MTRDPLLLDPILIMNKSTAQIGEFGLIDLIKKRTRKSSSVIEGIGDDTAVMLFTKNRFQLLTADMLVEDVHFTRKTSPRLIGHKAIACSISDIAAMGGIPKYAVISLGMPATCSTQFISALYEGMNATARKYKVSIVGGDTVLTKKMVINVSLTGEVLKNRLVTRRGAKKGDQIFVTGCLGQALQSGRHVKFTPRIDESQFLVKKYRPSSMIDISDGLAADLKHILKASRVGAVLEEREIPRRNQSSLKESLHDGEDFELLFTLSKSKAEKLQKVKQKSMHFFHIGEITAKRGGLQLNACDGRMRTILGKGYTHF